MKQHGIPGFALIVAVAAAACLAPAKEKKPKEAKPEPGPAAKADLPSDLNAASLRVQALDTLYQLDLTVPQLKALRESAGNAADPRKRTAAPNDDKIADALSRFAAALVAADDDDRVAKLRLAAGDLTGDESVKLDDDVDPTPAARPKAVEFAKRLNAGQVAAFLASHADQINDPAETMLATLESLHDGDDPADADGQVKDDQIKEVGDDVGWLAADDAAKAAAVAARVRDWFKANRELTPDQQAARHDALEASAKKAVGDVSGLDVIKHWMNNTVAELLSNPQLPSAVDAMLTAKEH